jgi:uncharacterized membrane protein
VMVDIATRALSPAINDPTTAVQVLDYLEETLRVVGAAPRQTRTALPETMTSAVIVPVRAWSDYLVLGMTEIRDYGASSLQVTRRMRAALEELGDLVLPENRPALAEELRRLDATVSAARATSIDLDLAMTSDHQGIGGPAIGGGPIDAATGDGGPSVASRLA